MAHDSGMVCVYGYLVRLKNLKIYATRNLRSSREI